MGLYISGVFSLIDCDNFDDEYIMDKKVYRSQDKYQYNKFNDFKNKNNYDEECPESSPTGWGFYEDISIYD